MINPEAKENNLPTAQEWDMSDVPFAGAEKEKLSQALRYAPDLLSATSAIFSGDIGRRSNFTDTAILGSNNQILENIRQLDNGDYFENYGVDSENRGYTGLGQVSGALDYFDKKYSSLIDNRNVRGLIKTSLAMWPVGAIGSFGVKQFAKSAKLDDGTAQLVNMLIDRNGVKLASARFDQNNHEAGEQLRQINEKYIEKITGDTFGSYAKEATCACNLQKIIMECAKNGAIIAKGRRAQK